VGGDRLDEAIMQHMKRAHGLLIGERTAEEIKIKIGSAAPHGEETVFQVRGLGVGVGLPKRVDLTSEEIRQALADPISGIVDAVRATLERCPPELAADLVDRGMVLTGGGALLRGLNVLLAGETGLPVHLPDDPLSAVAHGTGRILEGIELLRGITDDGIGTNGRG
jgi:rod shape-determining protein MreB